MQNKDTGGFLAHRMNSEEDLRFVYCACAIAKLCLGEDSEIDSCVDTNAILSYVKSCQTYEGGLGLHPGGLECQGGATFCGIASLVLCNRYEEFRKDKSREDDLLRWLMFRQTESKDDDLCGGFQGRCNKPPDSCYSFWNGATLALMGYDHLVDKPRIRRFILSCQHRNGGFAKFPNLYPDVLHSFYSLAWLSIAAEDSDKLGKIDIMLQSPML